MSVSPAVRALVARLQERGTWLHIINAATVLLGVKLAPEHQELWLTLGVVAGTVLGVLTKERRKVPK